MSSYHNDPDANADGRDDDEIIVKVLEQFLITGLQQITTQCTVIRQKKHVAVNFR